MEEQVIMLVSMGSYSVLARDLTEHLSNAFKEQEEIKSEELYKSLCKD